MESAEWSVPLAPHLLMNTTLRVTRIPWGHHNCFCIAGTSQGVLLRFDPDVAHGRSWTLLGNSPSILGVPSTNVLLLSSVLDHRPIPKRVKLCGRVGRISPEEDAVQAHLCSSWTQGDSNP